MTIWVALRNLRTRWVASLLTVLAVAVAGAAALVVPMLIDQVDRGASDAAQVFDLLITAKGGQVQAVASSVFLMDVPLGNVPGDLYEELLEDERTARVVPLGLGDSLRGFPIVGTSEALFELSLSAAAGPYFSLARGDMFQEPFEAVLGARVASELRLNVGDRFTTAHGFDQPGGELLHADGDHGHDDDDDHGHEPGGGGDHDHDVEYVVVGVMAPTGSAYDRAVLTPMESVWLVHGQVAAEARDVTALFYSARQANHFFTVAAEVNARPDAQAVFIGSVFGQLRGAVRQGEALYRLVSVIVLVLAALTVSLYIYSGALERRRQVALLRALGAGRTTVFGIAMLETLLAASLGFLLAVAFSWVIGTALSGPLGTAIGFILPAPVLQWQWLLAVAALVPLVLLVALVPALRTSMESPLEHL